MEEFFDGLDCRLRVSGMVADSIMMGIVNSAMEQAYEKSRSKEGGLERLNHKSRFCELATMQLEWCLKFLQDEVDGCMVESAGEREKLLSDLLETRDRIHNRLEETELAIAEKDRELIGRKESEDKLRMALEGKDEEISSLKYACSLEKEKRHGFLPCASIGELKDAIDQEILETRSKLDDGHEHLMCLMQKLNDFSLDVEKVEIELRVSAEEEYSNDDDKESNLMFEEEGNDGGRAMHKGITAVPKVYDESKICKAESLNGQVERLKEGFEEIAMNFDALKGKLESAFETLESSVSLLEATMDEQQLKWNTERETTNIVIKSFIRDAQHELHTSGALVDNFSPLLFDKNWSAFIDDITSLHSELEMLVVPKDEQPTQRPSSRVNARGKDNSKNLSMSVKAFPKEDEFGAPRNDDDGVDKLEQNEGTTESFSEIGKIGNSESSPKENPLGHSVAEIIKNHESIIRKKSEEINWLKGELSREKASSTLKGDRSLTAIEAIIPRIISRLDGIIKENAKLIAAYEDQKTALERGKNKVNNDLSGLELVNREEKMTQKISENSKKSGDRLCCHVNGSELCEEIKELKQEKQDFEFKAKMVEDTYGFLFKGLLRKLHLQLFDFDVETHLREDIFRIMYSEIVKEWKNDRESCKFETSVMEKIDHIVFSEIFKDIKCTVSSALTKYEAENFPNANNLLQSPGISEEMDGTREHDFILDNIAAKKGLNFNSNLMEPHINQEFIVCDIERSNEQYTQLAQLIDEKDDAFSSVNGKLEKASQQIAMSKMQLKELASSFGLAIDDKDVVQDHVVSAGPMIEKGDDSVSFPARIGESHWDELQLLLLPLTNFSQVIRHFELMACEKIKINMSRLKGLNTRLDPLLDQVNSIKRKEILYRKAFTRRCYDLQTAEAEVDLLGDEVDLLLSLLQKIYVALDHYSPVLQHYFGVMDILRLIRKELNGEVAVTSKQ